MKQLLRATLLTFSLLFSPLLLAEMVNINKADAAALMENLPGIGEVKAKAIVDHRKKNGDFKSIDDLLKVQGIGEATFKNIKSEVSTSKGAAKATGKKAITSTKQLGASSTDSDTKTAKSTKKDDKVSDAAAAKPTKKDDKGSDTTSTKTADKDSKEQPKSADKSDKPKAKSVSKTEGTGSGKAAKDSKSTSKSSKTKSADKATTKSAKKVKKSNKPASKNAQSAKKKKILKQADKK